MNAISFLANDRSATISIEELSKTMELGDHMGRMPKNIPVQPGQFLVDVMSRINRITGIAATQEPIIIREQYCQVNRQKIKEDKPLELEDYIIKRFVSKIKLPNLTSNISGEEVTGALALSYAYTDAIKGIQIAFGENVSVCENLTAFGRYRFTTYSRDKVSFEEGMQLLDAWLGNIQDIHSAHINTIANLQSRRVRKEEFEHFIGSLFIPAVVNNNGYTAMAPLNQSQVAMVVSNAYDNKTDFDDLTAWDVMNMGTYVIKPNTSDMLTVISDTTDFNDFVLDQFDIPFELA